MMSRRYRERTSWKLGVLLAGGALLITGCGAAGAGSGSVARKDLVDRASSTAAGPETRGEVLPVPEPVATPEPAVRARTIDRDEAAAAELPVVTIRTVADGSVLMNDGRPCSDMSAASLGPGQLEVLRTGPVGSPLTVRFTTAGPAGSNGDVEALPNEITIPAGASTASVWVTPSAAHAPPPLHLHRSSALSLTLVDSGSYEVGDTASAELTLRFDFDLFGCEPVASDPAAVAVLPMG